MSMECDAVNDIVRQATPGKYRVVATDTLPWPYESSVLGEYSSLKDAKRAADAECKRGGSMTYLSIYDDQRELIYVTYYD